MIFNKLKHRSISRHIKKLLSQRSLVTSNDEAKTLVVLTDLDKFYDKSYFLDLAKSLGIAETNYTLLVFSSNKKTIKTYTGSLLTYSKIGWKGVIKDAQLKRLLAEDTDVLINYFKGENIALELASASCNAGFRIGLSQANKKLNDLIVDCKLSETKLFKMEMIKYLKVLNKL